MLKRLAIVLVLLVAVIGTVFLGLDILDISEGARFEFPVEIVDILISLFQLAAFLAAAISYVRTGRRLRLWLGAGALAFGLGNLIRVGLPDASANTVITSQETIALLAALLHIGAGWYAGPARFSRTDPRLSRGIFPGGYIIVIAAIAAIIILSSRDVFPPFIEPGIHASPLRDIVRGITAFLFVVGAFFLVRRSPGAGAGLFFWYGAGLLLLALGTTFLSLAAIDSRLFWTGKFSLLLGGVYLIPAALSGHQPID